jgi:beta-glucanase (GH16 family)
MKIVVLLSFAMSLLLFSCTISQIETPSNTGGSTSVSVYDPGGYGWTVVWADEFDGTNINSSNWVFDIGTGPGSDGWGNFELQYYTSNTNNAFVSDGKLTIRALQDTSYGTAYTSARLKTKGKHAWTFGKITARIKHPYGQGILPMFWMLGNSYNGANWPNCGEIVVGEMFGGGGNSNKTALSALYWLKNGVITEFRSQTNLSGDLHASFHIYEIEWTPVSVTARIDGIRYLFTETITGDMTAFQDPFFILLNLAVGGIWAGAPDGSTVFPQQMEIDWVRVYQRSTDAPVLTVAYPQDAATVYGAFPVMGTTTGSNTIAATCLSVDHSSFTTLNDPTNWSSNLNLSSGGHNLRVYSLDSYGVSSATNDMTVTVTWVKPRVVITSVPPFGTNDLVHGTVSGVTPALYKISLWIFVPGWGWVPKPYFNAPYSTLQNDGSWDSVYVSGGSDAWATIFIADLVPSYMPYDPTGYLLVNQITNYTVTFGSYNRADASAPSNFVLTYPTNGASVVGKNHTFTIRGSFADDQGGGTVWISLNGSAFIPDPLELLATSFAVDKTLPEGNNTLSAFVVDDGGYSTQTNQIAFNFVNDDTPPVFQVLSPLNNEHIVWPGSVTLSGTANDLHGVLSVYLQMDNLGFFKANGTTNWNLVWPFLNSGTHTLQVYSEDTVTNTSTTNTTMFFVD